MRWEPFFAVPLAVASTAASASVFFSTEQAQQVMFPAGKFTKVALAMTPEQRDGLFARSGVHEPFREDGVWSVEGQGFFIVDQVVGKHELITYAVGLNLDGSVKQIDPRIPRDLRLRGARGRVAAAVCRQDCRVASQAQQVHRQHHGRHAVLQAHHRRGAAGSGCL